MITVKLVIEILGSTDIKLSFAYMNLQQESRYVIPWNLRKAREVETHRRFISGEMSVRLNHITMENKSSPGSIGKKIRYRYDFNRNLKTTYLPT